MLGQVPFVLHSSADTTGGLFGQMPSMVYLSFGYLALQFVTICRILTRSDLDAQNKILWVLVTMFVPLGSVLYLFLGPEVAPSVAAPRRAASGGDVSGTPWADDPGHSRRT